jgi:hypothetical protein
MSRVLEYLDKYIEAPTVNRVEAWTVEGVTWRPLWQEIPRLIRQSVREFVEFESEDIRRRPERLTQFDFEYFLIRVVLNAAPIFAVVFVISGFFGEVMALTALLAEIDYESFRELIFLCTLLLLVQSSLVLATAFTLAAKVPTRTANPTTQPPDEKGGDEDAEPWL